MAGTCAASVPSLLLLQLVCRWCYFVSLLLLLQIHAKIFPAKSFFAWSFASLVAFASSICNLPLYWSAHSRENILCSLSSNETNFHRDDALYTWWMHCQGGIGPCWGKSQNFEDSSWMGFDEVCLRTCTTSGSLHGHRG